MIVLARLTAVCVSALALTACDRPAAEPSPPTSPSAEASPQPQAEGGLAVEGEGLRLVSASGSATPIPFGTSQDTVIGMVVGFLGGRDVPTVTTNAECGAGPTQFATFQNGLQLAFQDDKFAGWFLDKAGLTTTDGVGVGSTRAAASESGELQIDPDSTLGVEFSSGDLGGFLTSTDANATVESLYAGLTCFFR